MARVKRTSATTPPQSPNPPPTTRRRLNQPASASRNPLPSPPPPLPTAEEEAAIERVIQEATLSGDESVSSEATTSRSRSRTPPPPPPSLPAATPGSSKSLRRSTRALASQPPPAQPTPVDSSESETESEGKNPPSPPPPQPAPAATPSTTRGSRRATRTPQHSTPVINLTSPSASVPTEVPASAPPVDPDADSQSRAAKGKAKVVESPAVTTPAPTLHDAPSNPKYIHVATCAALGIDQQVKSYIQNIGWENFFHIQHDTFLEPCQEFYSGFSFKEQPADTFSLKTPEVIRFTVLGDTYSFSITDFNIALGLVDRDFTKTRKYKKGLCNYVPEFNPQSFYQELVQDPTAVYNPSSSLDVCFTDHALLYLHRILAYTFTGRPQYSGVVSKQELFFLWAMKTGQYVNLGYWLGTQMDTAQRRKKILLGGIVTHFLVQRKLFNPIRQKFHAIQRMQPLDMHTLEKMRVIEKDATGTPFFKKPEDVRAQQQQQAQPQSIFETISLRLTALETILEEIRDVQYELHENQKAIAATMVTRLPFP